MRAESRMGVLDFLKDARFNIFFSFVLGVGLVCIIRPICSGSDCNVTKAPLEKDFDKFVYRMGQKCFEFKTDVVECPASGAIEAFRECQNKDSENEGFKDEFSRRESPIKRCD
jgi:hypothetical protein